MTKRMPTDGRMSSAQSQSMRVKIVEVDCEEIKAGKRTWSDAGDYPSGTEQGRLPSKDVYTISGRYRVTFNLFLKNGYQYIGPVDVTWFDEEGIEETLSGHSALPKSQRKTAEEYLREIVLSDWKESLSAKDQLGELEIPFFDLRFSDLKRLGINQVSVLMEVTDE